jgi:hypothetical protein
MIKIKNREDEKRNHTKITNREYEKRNCIKITNEKDITEQDDKTIKETIKKRNDDQKMQ